jgi:hypothetical protein
MDGNDISHAEHAALSLHVSSCGRIRLGAVDRQISRRLTVCR